MVVGNNEWATTKNVELYTDSVFWYEPFGIFPVFSYRIPKGKSVSKFGIIKLAGALYTHIVTTRRRLLSARILPLALLQCRVCVCV